MSFTYVLRMSHGDPKGRKKKETSQVSKFETGKGVPEKGSNSVYDLMYQSEIRRKKKGEGNV